MALTLHDIDSEVHNIAIKSTAGNELSIDSSGLITSKISDGTDSLGINADGSLNVILSDGTDPLAINADGSLNVILSDGTDALDINADGSLNTIITDGTDTLAINADGSVNASIVEAGLSSWKNTAQTVNTTASELAATPLAGRVKMVIQNLGSQDAYLGFDNTVTTANGIILPAKSTFEFPYNATANVWAITSSGSADIRIGEYAN